MRCTDTRFYSKPSSPSERDVLFSDKVSPHIDTTDFSRFRIDVSFIIQTYPESRKSCGVSEMSVL